MDELVQRLANGDHPVTIGGPNSSFEEFHRRLTEIGYVFIQFTDTQGHTNLGVRVDEAATGLHSADFANAIGTVHVEGNLTLNYVPVRCIADIDLATLSGVGRLEIRRE